MQITTVEYSQFKGRTGNHKLSKATMVVGPNFSGKTTILEACRVALLGYTPDLGKTNQATFQLATGSSMLASVHFDDGRDAGVRFHMEKDSIKRNLINTGPIKFSSTLLDAQEYFALSADKQVDYIFARADLGESWKADGILARLKRLSLGDAHTEKAQKIQSDILDICIEEIEFQPSIAIALESLVAVRLKDDMTASKAREKSTMGAIQTLAELKLREDECSAETLTDLTNEKERVRGALELKGPDYGRLMQLRDESLMRTSRRLRIEEDLRLPAAVVKQPSAHFEEKTKELRGEIASMEREIEAFRAPDLNVRIKRLDAETNSDFATKKFDALDAKVRELRKELSEVEALDCCPFCKSKTKGWRTRVIDAITAQISAITPEWEGARKTALELAVTASAAQLAKEAEEARIASQRTVINRLSVKQRELSALRLDADAERQQIEHQQRLAASREGADAQLRAELKSLDDAPKFNADEFEEMKREIAALQQQQRAVDGRLVAAQRLQHDLRRAAEAEAEHRTAATRVEVLKMVGKELKAMRGEMVEAAFGSILEVANKLTSILETPLAFHQGQLGRWSNGAWVPHSTFSGVERALAYVALAAALSESDEFKLLLLDELGNFTQEARDELAEVLLNAVEEGILDQVVCALPFDQDEAMTAKFDGWTTIVTGGAW